MIAVGVGCRRGCPAQDIVALIRMAFGHLPPDVVPDGLFSVADKCREPGLQDAAATLGLPLTALDPALLRLVAADVKSCSRRVEEIYGLPGIAETAALAGAGQGAVLLVPRLAGATVTCAIASRR